MFQLQQQDLLVNVVHHFVVPAACVDFGNYSWRQTVHQLAQNNTVPEGILEGHWGETFSNHRFDPVLRFTFLLWLTLSGDLQLMDFKKNRLISGLIEFIGASKDRKQLQWG